MIKDSTCQCYPYFLEYKNYLILFYNGEDYGKVVLELLLEGTFYDYQI